MRSRLTVVLVLLSCPPAARADVVTPGFSRVPNHLVIEVGGDYPAYRFWLVSARGAEPLDLAPGRPCRVDGRERHGSHRIAYVVAVPGELVENLKTAGQWEGGLSGKLPPGVLRSGPIDFSASVPFYDSRREVIDSYRLELVPGEEVRLVWVGQNAGDWWVKASWAAAGVLAFAGVAWLGYRLLRRLGPGVALTR